MGFVGWILNIFFVASPPHAQADGRTNKRSGDRGSHGRPANGRRGRTRRRHDACTDGFPTGRRNGRDGDGRWHGRPGQRTPVRTLRQRTDTAAAFAPVCGRTRPDTAPTVAGSPQVGEPGRFGGDCRCPVGASWKIRVFTPITRIWVSAPRKINSLF